MLSIGEIWLGSATSASAAITQETASSSGTPAATSEPNATTRISSVSGREISSAFARSLVKVSLSSLLELTLPNCSTSRSGLAAWTEPIASSAGSSRSLASRSSPVISKSINTVRPSSDTDPAPSSGDSTFSTYSARASRSLTCSIAVANSGSSIVNDSLWMTATSSLGLIPSS